MIIHRILPLLLAALLVLPVWQGSADAASRTPVAVYVDGVELNAAPGAYSENGRTMVPMRAIFEALHAEVTWDDKTKTVIGRTADRTVQLKLDAKSATVNGKQVPLDAPARSVDGRVMVPLRFVSESLGYPVAFNDKSGLYKNEPKVVIVTNPAVSIQYGDLIDGATANDYYYGNYFSPATRYMFTEGERIHILKSSGNAGIKVYHYDLQLKLIGTTEIDNELPKFGGFHPSDDGYYYIIFGQSNREEDPDKVVYRIVKYDRNWNKAGQADIRDVYTSEPFDASNVTMDSRDGLLVVHSARTRYVSDDGLRHQSNITFKIRTSDMQVLDKGGQWPRNHVSHSFAAYVRFDGSRIVYADHGDAYPRSIVLQTDDNGRITSERDIITFPGKIGDNFTGAHLGGLEVSDTHYLLAGSSIYPKLEYLSGNSKNVFVAAVPKADVRSGPIELNWLTDFKDFTGDEHYDMRPTVREVHLVPLDGQRYVVLWHQIGGGDSSGTYFAIVDGAGKTVKPPAKLAGVPAPGHVDPLVIGNKLLWFDRDGGKTIFYSIDLSKA